MGLPIFEERDRVAPNAVEAYRLTVPEAQFDLELLSSARWNTCPIIEAIGALRRVVLRLASSAQSR
jgi:hypothetical protein